MRVGVVGSRSIQDKDLVWKTLDSMSDVDLIVSGGARGPDSFAEEWFRSKGKEPLVFYPEWDVYGVPQAAYIRNTLIVENSDIILAFWDGESGGTLDSVKKARKMNKPVKVFNLSEIHFFNQF